MMKSDHGKLWPPNLSRSPFPQPLLGADAVCPRARSGCQAGSGDPRRGGQPEAAATSPSPELGAGAGARAAQTLRPSPLSLPGVSSWRGRGTKGRLGPASSARSGPPAWGVSGRGRNVGLGSTQVQAPTHPGVCPEHPGDSGVPGPGSRGCPPGPEPLPDQEKPAARRVRLFQEENTGADADCTRRHGPPPCTLGG